MFNSKFGSLPPGQIPEDLSSLTVAASVAKAPSGTTRLLRITNGGYAGVVLGVSYVPLGLLPRWDENAPRLVNSRVGSR